MSADTWIQVFYPIPAGYMPVADAVAHSLQKWRGLTSESLRMHGLTKPPITVDGKTCALCQVFLWGPDPRTCDGCPLTEVLGHSCDEDERERECEFVCDIE